MQVCQSGVQVIDLKFVEHPIVVLVQLGHLIQALADFGNRLPLGQLALRRLAFLRVRIVDPEGLAVASQPLLDLQQLGPELFTQVLPIRTDGPKVATAADLADDRPQFADAIRQVHRQLQFGGPLGTDTLRQPAIRIDAAKTAEREHGHAQEQHRAAEPQLLANRPARKQGDLPVRKKALPDIPLPATVPDAETDFARAAECTKGLAIRARRNVGQRDDR